MSPRRRIALDVSGLPTSAFGIRDIMAWGTMAFMVIEGFTLVLCAVVFLYLLKNFGALPPEGTPLPGLVVPTLQVVVMVASLFLMKRLDHHAHHRDLVKVRRLLTVATGVSAAMVGMRVWELTRSLNVWWDTNAYGSAQWLIVGAHGTLLAIQYFEVFGMMAIFRRGPVEKKHFADAADIAFYWMFIVYAWVPLYFLCFVLPYLI